VRVLFACVQAVSVVTQIPSAKPSNNPDTMTRRPVRDLKRPAWQRRVFFMMQYKLTRKPSFLDKTKSAFRLRRHVNHHRINIYHV